MFEPPVPVAPVAGAILMPDLKRLGENQAKELLASLGVGPGLVYVDYQSRAQIPDVFDQFAPYSVVSSLPAAGDWILPGTTVILGVRSPEDAPQPPPGTAPTAEPPAHSDTPPALPTAQPPEPTAVPPLPLPPTLPQPVPPGRP